MCTKQNHTVKLQLHLPLATYNLLLKNCGVGQHYVSELYEGAPWAPALDNTSAPCPPLLELNVLSFGVDLIMVGGKKGGN